MKCLLGFLLLISTFIFVYSRIDYKIDNYKNCECIKYNCGCCTKLKIPSVMDGILCSNFSYLPKYGISVTITYNDIDIFNETITATNPPPICVIYIEKIKMNICLRFYDLDIKNKCFSGCAEFEITFFNLLPLKKIKLGCFGCRDNLYIHLNTKLRNSVYYLTEKSKQYNEEPKIVLI